MSLTVPPRPIRTGRALCLGVVTLASFIACGPASGGTDIAATPAPSGRSVVTLPSPTPTPTPRIRIGPPATTAGPCDEVADLEEQVAGLRAVELRVENRVTLDIELGKVQAAFAQLDRTELGELEDQLEGPLRRLGYRLIDLEIAVEDFRTNPRPRQAAAHVDEDASAFDEGVSGIAILSRC